MNPKDLMLSTFASPNGFELNNITFTMKGFEKVLKQLLATYKDGGIYKMTNPKICVSIKIDVIDSK